MDVNSLPKTVTRQRRDCDLNPGPSAPESSTLTTRLPSHPLTRIEKANEDSQALQTSKLSAASIVFSYRSSRKTVDVLLLCFSSS